MENTQNPELKQLKKLVAKLIKIKDLAISCKKRGITLFFLTIALVILLIPFICWVANYIDIHFIAKHLILFIVLGAIDTISIIVLSFYVISNFSFCKENYKRLNLSIKSLYTLDIIDYEVKQTIRRYKQEIIFCSHIKRIFYIPQLSIPKISFLQTKIDKLQRRKPSTLNPKTYESRITIK